MNSKTKRIIIYIACAFLAASVAIAAIIAIIHNLKIKTVFSSDFSSATSSVIKPTVSSFPEITEPIISEPEYLEITQETASKIEIDEVKDMVEAVKPSKENIIKVTETTINASELKKRSVKLPVKYLSQNPELPTGCEITALTTVLNYYGFDVSKTVMAKNYLPKSTEFPANFWEVFLGDPTKETGFGCYAQPITDAANKYLSELDADFKAINRSGSQFEALLKEVEKGRPVVIWGTIDMQQPYTTYEWVVGGKELKWIRPEHCMVLIGYDIDRGVAIISDPQKGIVEYDLETVKARYIALHSQCVVIEAIDTPPVITGAIGSEIYFVSQKITVTDENLAEVTVNGVSHPTEFILEGNTDKIYEIIASDDSGHISTLTIEMKSISSVLKPIEGITKLNVTSDNKEDIESIKGIITSINTENATTQEILYLDEISSSCDMLISVITSTSEEIARIKKAFTRYLLLGVSKNDKDDLEKLHTDIDSLTSSQNLTMDERESLELLRIKCDNYLLEIAKKDS